MNSPVARCAVLTALTLATLSPHAFAASDTYTGPDGGNWATPGNWSLGAIPTTGDDAILGSHSAGTSTLDVTLNTTVPATFGNSLHSLTLNSSALSAFMILNETAGGSLYAINETIGTTTSDNTFNQSGGSSNQIESLYLGLNSSSGANNYNLSGSGTTLLLGDGNSGTVIVGLSGAGTFNQSGGNVTSTDGFAVFGGAIILGGFSGSTGTYNLSGGNINLYGNLSVGSGGTGIFNQTGGTISNTIITVSTSNGTATFNCSNGSLGTNTSINIGTNGTFKLLSNGTLNYLVNIDNGGTFTAGANASGINGGVTFTGGTLTLQGNNLTLFTISGTTGTIKNGAAAPAVLTLAGTSSFSGAIQDGSNGSLGLTVSGGTTTLSGTGFTYSGPTTITAGTLLAGSNGTFSPNSNVILAGGTLSAANLTVSVASISGASGSVLVFGNGGNLSVGSNNASTSFGGAINGAGTFTKTGSGVLTLTGGGNFAGTVNISSGAITIGATNGLPTAAAVTCGIGANLNIAANQSLASLSSGVLNQLTFTNNATLTLGATNADSTVPGYNITGAGTIIKTGNGNLTIGFGPSDNFANTDAALTIAANAGTVTLAKQPGTDAIAGPLTIGGATVLLTGSNQIDDASNVSISAGTFNVNGFTETIGALSLNAGTITLNGGNLTVASLSGAGGSINLGGGTFIAAQNINTTSAAALPNAGTFVKAGSGNLTLTGAGSYTGNYTVNAGRLILVGNVSTSNITINPGGTLQFNTTTLNLAGSQLLAGSGATIEYAGANISNGFLRGAGIHVILNGPASTFNGVTTFNSTTLTQNGPASFNNFTNGGTITNNASLTINGATNNTSGIINVNNVLNTQDFTNNGVINIAANASLTNSGSNLFLGGGARMFIGTKAAPGGTLTLQGGTTLEVNGALLVNDGTISGTTNVNYAGTAQGIGAYGPVNVSFGGTFQPGFASASFPGNAASISQLSGNGTIDNTSAGPMTLNLTGNSVSTFSGPIQNSNGTTTLAIQGTSQLTLSTSPLSGGGNSINTYTGGTTIAPGAALIIAATGALPNAQPITNDGTFTVNANSTSGQISGLGTTTLGNNVTLTISQNTGASKLSNLTLGTNAQLNLTTNPLVIEAIPANKAALVTQLAAEVSTGRNGGLWNGPGITSSTVAANPSQLTIAVADNAVLNRVAIGGQTVDTNSILVVPAYFGDANLDGHVDLADLNTVLNNFGSATAAWTSGNFRGTTTINLTDIADVLNNFGQTYPAPAFPQAPNPVPEPASLFLLLPLLLAARRRKSPIQLLPH